MISGILIASFLSFSACIFSKPEPAPPNLELSGDICTVNYGVKEYKASVTHIFQGLTSITFFEPNELEGVVYTFSENGCSIMLNDLKFTTDRSFMGDSSLPQIICDVLSNASKEDAVKYIECETPQASTLITATFSGNTEHYPYTITTDFNSGFIKEIKVDQCNFKATFSNR